VRDWRNIIRRILQSISEKANKQGLKNGSAPQNESVNYAWEDNIRLSRIRKREARIEQKEQLAYLDPTGKKHLLSYEDSMGVRYPITLAATMYEDTKSFCLRFIRHENGVPESLDTITVNVDEMPPYMSYVKDGPEDQWMLSIIKKAGLGEKMWSKNQYEPYGMVQFNEEMLRELKCEGMETYHKTIVSKYCGKIDCWDDGGWPVETRYYTDFKTMKDAKKDLEDCGHPHGALMYHVKNITSRIHNARTTYRTDIRIKKCKSIKTDKRLTLLRF